MANKVPTYEELMARQDKVFVSEYEDFLYVKLPPREHYDNTIWKVNKRTHEVTYMMFTKYLVTIDEQATYLYAAPEWKTRPA